MSLIRDFVTTGLSQATLQASATTASHYARFQSAAHNIKPVISLLEVREQVSDELVLFVKLFEWIEGLKYFKSSLYFRQFLMLQTQP